MLQNKVFGQPNSRESPIYPSPEGPTVVISCIIILQYPNWAVGISTTLLSGQLALFRIVVGFVYLHVDRTLSILFFILL